MEINDLFVSKEISKLLGENSLTKLFEIYNEFKDDDDLIKLSLKAQNSYYKKNLELSNYMIYFVNTLIENIFIALSKDKNNKSFCLKLVISYLFKIINSNFNFFPSHKLVLLIYYYLSSSIMYESILENQINGYINELNEDLYKCYQFFHTKFLKEGEGNTYDIKDTNSFEVNIDGIMKLKKNYSAIPYLEFFIKFLNYSSEIKYCYILFIKFIKQYENNKNYDGIINLYSLLNYLKINYSSEEKLSSSFAKIKNAITKNLTNSSVKNILRYSLKMLESNSLSEIKDISKEINYDAKKPVCSSKFINDKEYYEDLEKEFYFILNNIKSPPKILNLAEERNYWCIIIKMLEFLLDDDIIHNSTIKILFQCIVDLSNDNLDFRIEDDFISNIINDLLKNIFENKIDILLYPEISFLLNNNRDIYDIFLKEKIEEEFYFRVEKDILSQLTTNEIEYFDMKSIENNEFKNIYFPFLAELLFDKDEKLLKNINSYKFYISYKSEKKNNTKEYIFYLLYIYFNNYFQNKEYKFFNLHIQGIIGKNIEKYMRQILKSNDFLKLVKKIIKSNVIKEAYSIINNNDNDIDNDTSQESNVKIINNKYNIFQFYQNFCENIDNYINDETFILMPLSRHYKAFTVRFLKIVINIYDIKFIHEDPDTNEDTDILLLKSYLVFLLINELNNLIILLNNVEEDSEKANPKQKRKKELMNLLFDHYLLNHYFDLEKAKYLLDLNNWEKKNLKDFKEGYIPIVGPKKGTPISYLYTGFSQICYDGFLRD